MKHGFVLMVGVAAALGLALGGSATETITMSASPTITRASASVTAMGAVGSGRGDQLVTVQSRPCDQTTWRDVAETTTQEGGGWTIAFSPGISGLFRAASAGAESEAVKLQTRPSVSLGQRPPGKFFVTVNAQRQFWHRRVVLQRFDTKKRVWIDVRRILLTETGATPGQPWIWSRTDKVRVVVPKGTTMRAVLPLSATRPCYLAGYSNLLRR
jgi:hypothetical protein